MIKNLFVCVILIFIIAVSTGCSKDEILTHYNNIIQSAGKGTLTSNYELNGDREFGVDDYVGTYIAQYENYSGIEYVFGGTSIEHESGSEVTITCKINTTSGSAQLILLSGSDKPVVLCKNNKVYKVTLKIQDGSNYIGIKGYNFTGNIELNIK